MSIKSRMSQKTLEQIRKITRVPLTVGSYLRAIREGENKTQVVFAKELDMSPSYLCDVELGRTLVSPGRAAELAHILGYSEEQFIRLALQDILERDHIDGYIIDLSSRDESEEEGQRRM